MLNRTITLLIVLVLALAFGAVVVASSMSGEEPKTHTMPGGEQMDGSEMGR
jgi:hypothetical protein